MNREIWWGTPTWYYDLPTEDINTDILEHECYEVMKKEKGVVNSNIHGWQSDSITSIRKDTPVMNKLINIAMYKAVLVFEDYGIKSNYKCSFENAWININQKGASNLAHIHPGCILSGVFYVKCNEDSGDFYMLNDKPSNYINASITKRDNAFTYESVGYKPIKNRLILFPSWVLHGVQDNKSDEDRISIAFNIGKI